jgi:hypothetical protein
MSPQGNYGWHMAIFVAWPPEKGWLPNCSFPNFIIIFFEKKLSFIYLYFINIVTRIAILLVLTRRLTTKFDSIERFVN